ncbi:MAG: acyltransferase domain-containing protein, partial [Pseudonocardia sp.]|nr:acyltransferase domain-containing protein [Pseudonocardia sp.]
APASDDCRVLSAGALPWLLSAADPAALGSLALRLHEHVERSGADPGGVARALVHTRSALTHRAVVLGDGRSAALRTLGEPGAAVPADVVTGTARRRRCVFVFPGQGAQWSGMAAGLLDTSPVFAARIAECATALAPHVDWSLVDVLRGEAGAPSLDAADVVQPALWAMMVGLGAVWRAAGVEPVAVVGHSQGEAAAACVAGALSIDDAARVVATRSQLIRERMDGGGGMATLAVPAGAAAELVARWNGRIAVAAVNSPRTTVVSGETAAIDELLEHCAERGVWCRRVAVRFASHSAQVEDLRAPLDEALAGLTPRSSDVALFSTLTGGRIDTATMDAGYWYANLRGTVAFDAACREVLGRYPDALFVEISPHPVLSVALSDIVEDAGTAAVAVGSLRRDTDGATALVSALGQAWAHGADVDWATVVGPRAAGIVDLPTYPFRHESFWVVPAGAGGDPAANGQRATGHPLLGASVTVADAGRVLLTGRLGGHGQRWLSDHTVAGTSVLPGTGLVEMALRAGTEVGCARLDELTLHAPLVLPVGTGVAVQVLVGEPDRTDRRDVEIFARPDGSAPDTVWTRHATGVVAPAAAVRDVPATGAGDEGWAATWPPPDAQPVDVEGFYPGLAASGLEYGPVFRGLRAAWCTADEVFAEVELPAEQAEVSDRYLLHPALLDAALQTLGVGAGDGPDAERGGTPNLPFSFGDVVLHATGAAALRVRVRRLDGPADAVTVEVRDVAGRPVLDVGSLVLRALPDAAALARSGDDVALQAPTWAELSAGGIAPAAVALAGEAAAWATPLRAAAIAVRSHPDLAAAAAAPAELTVVALTPTPAGVDAVAARSAAAHAVLATVRAWQADAPAAKPLRGVTGGATVGHDGDPGGAVDRAQATAWGVVRTAQSEHPGRFALLDLSPDAGESGAELCAALPAVVAGENQLAVRAGAVRALRLARWTDSATLVEPPGPWRLASTRPGTLNSLRLVEAPDAAAPLAAGQVRIRARAAGMNFRDVLLALDMYGGTGHLGNECSGVVTETAPDVTGFAVGDRVAAVVPGGIAPQVVADARMTVRIPDRWSFAEAATMPIAYTTAWFGLADIAGIGPGTTVLVHAATGGVGSAAVALARAWGAEVFATASPGKWDALRAAGFDDAHIASSRDLDFEQAVLAATGGRGVDVVLDCLAGEFVDASLRLLPRGGHFVEIGRRDVRDPAEVAAAHPGVAYRQYDL